MIESAGVAKATLYRHFRSKDDLVLAFLEQREQRWTPARRGGGEAAGSTPEEQLLAIFDVFDEWFRRDDFEACSFINVLLEMGPRAPRRGARASSTSRTSARSCAASPRKPACAIPTPSPARGTSS